ncbi:MAG: hypothetical protein RIA64_01430 [Rhodospirillales bacterium]
MAKPKLAEDNADQAAATEKKNTRGFSFENTKPIPPKDDTKQSARENDGPMDGPDHEHDPDDADHEDRLTRDQESRYAEELSDEDDYEDDWEERDLLDAPEPRPGFAQRWVRTMADGKPDAQNLAKRLNRGWQPRSADTVPKGTFCPTIQHGEFAGVVGIEGMILMERPLKRQMAQRRKNREYTVSQMQGVESDMNRIHDPQSGLGAPQFEHNKTSVMRGRRVAVAEDD